MVLLLLAATVALVSRQLFRERLPRMVAVAVEQFIHQELRVQAELAAAKLLD